MTLIAVYWSYLRSAAQSKARSERGASIIEYALLLALIAILCVGAVTLIGSTTRNSLSSSASAME